MTISPFIPSAAADIRNILEFEKDYPDVRVIKLEQNYRSTQTILHAANGVISHNIQRKNKQLWTENPVGEKIIKYKAGDDRRGGLGGAGNRAFGPAGPCL